MQGKKTIIRVVKNEENPFVMIDKRPLHNPELSWKAKGILSFLLSLPDDWQIRRKHLLEMATDGDTSLRSGLQELKKHGHLVNRFIKGEDGKIVDHILEVHEVPLDVENPQVGKTSSRKTHHINNKESTKKDSTNTTTEGEKKKNEKKPQKQKKAQKGKSRNTLVEQTLEPTYVKAGDEFEDEAQKRKRRIPKWKKPKDDLAKRALKACGRKHYADRKERSRWLAITKSMLPLDAGPSKYPLEWVEHCIEWPEKENRKYRSKGKYGVKIKFPSLLGYIENEAKKIDFISDLEESRDRRGRAGDPNVDAEAEMEELANQPTVGQEIDDEYADLVR